MKKRIFSNWGLKLVSLFLAFGLWIAVVVIENPPDTKVFRNIPVKLINEASLTEKGKVYEILEGSDVVRSLTVKAPRDVLSRLSENDIVATADVSKLTNMDTIQVEFNLNKNSDADYEIVSGVENAVVKLFVEDRKSINVQLRVNTTGEVADGYQLDYARAEENRLNIWGGESKIDQVSYAAVNVDVTDLTSELSISETIRLYDKDNNIIDDATIHKKVDTMRVTVGVLATKYVPVEYSVSGTPAAGYRTTGVIESVPDKIKIAGSTSAISNISKITIPEEQLNVAGLTDDLVYSYDIRNFLPEGIQLADDKFKGTVSVTVFIEKEMQKKLNIPVGNIQIINVPADYTMEIQDETDSYELRVTGLSDSISLLHETTVRGTVDVAGWMKEQGMSELQPGSYQIPVDFGFAEEITVEQPVRVRINFTKPDNSVTANN